MRKVKINGNDRDYLFDRLEAILHDDGCNEFKEKVLEDFAKCFGDEDDNEDKDLSLKPFNLEKAKDGKPVCTRDGRKARIICFDKKGGIPIVALIEENQDGKSKEEINYFYVNGCSVSNTIESKDDLLMAPESHEGWINLYRRANDNKIEGGYVYSSEKEALESTATTSEYYVATVKIGWEE